MNIYDFFFIRPIRLVSKRQRINKILPSLQFLFVCRHFETKRLLLKSNNKHHIYSLPVFIARPDVSPVLKSTFKFQILMPSAHTIYVNSHCKNPCYARTCCSM